MFGSGKTRSGSNKLKIIHVTQYWYDKHFYTKDIWNTLPDVFASIANYLKQKGWREGEPIRMQVDVPYGINKDVMGLKNKLPIQEWSKIGVRTASGAPLPSNGLEASLVEPYGGPNFLVFNNFKVLMRYNNSIYYAATIAYMADQICTVR